MLRGFGGVFCLFSGLGWFWFGFFFFMAYDGNKVLIGPGNTDLISQNLW